MKTIATIGLIAALFTSQPYPVIYDDLALNNILMVYADQPREIPMCQFGFERNGIRFVNEVRIPYVIESTETMADFYRPNCDSPDYLGIIHNHNNGICFPSEVDLERFINDDEASIESIVCYANVKNNHLTMNHYIKDQLSDSIMRMYKQ